MTNTDDVNHFIGSHEHELPVHFGENRQAIVKIHKFRVAYFNSVAIHQQYREGAKWRLPR